jgi:hypothetical protein
MAARAVREGPEQQAVQAEQEAVLGQPDTEEGWPASVPVSSIILMHREMFLSLAAQAA